MTYEVLVKQKNATYVAVALGLPGIAVEAATRQDAIQRVSDAVEAYLTDSEIVQIEISTGNNKAFRKPLSQFIGMWASDPQFEQVLEHIQQQRAVVDSDPAQL